MSVLSVLFNFKVLIPVMVALTVLQILIYKKTDFPYKPQFPRSWEVLKVYLKIVFTYLLPRSIPGIMVLSAVIFIIWYFFNATPQ